MCHLILLLPLITLPVFWLLPFDVALPLYSLVLIVSALMYLKISQTLRLPVTTGKEALLRATGYVQKIEDRMVTVRINNEQWSAVGEDLETGDRIEVLAIEGLMLKVRKIISLRTLDTNTSEIHSCH